MPAVTPLDIPALVPLFPLADHVLLPASPTPYRIHEAGHRRMVMELLDRPADERWIAVPRLVEGGPRGDDGSAPFHRVATVGLLRLATPLADGGFLAVVDGRAVCDIREVEAPFSPYRLGRATRLEDAPEESEGPSTTDLVQAMFSLLDTLGPGAADLPVSYGDTPADPLMDFRIAAAVIDGADARQALLEERDPTQRRAVVHAALVERLAAACRDAAAGPAGTEASR